jgi:predicted CXXCH cytochrome family protein
MFVLLAAGANTAAQTKDTCADCHAGLPEPYGVSADQFAADIHAQKGLTCAGCHGGDASADDPEHAMSRNAGFRGPIRKPDIPRLCGRCHENPAYMRRYNPSLRTDQLAQYETSRHGKLLASGDMKVAVCTDCHGVHGIRPASDPRSSVHAMNIAKTCARCHADAEYMKSYRILTDQFAAYSQSVHSRAMTARGDLSAPTCSTCHGNHGASPPGVASVVQVCSTCHVFQAQLFEKSPHGPAFAAAQLPGCVSCHGNHKILPPTDAMLGADQTSVCADCHSAGTHPTDVAVEMRERLAALQSAIAQSEEVLNRAERSGMEVGQARLQQAQARDALTKARVSVHSLDVTAVGQETSAGLKTAAATYVAGKAALAERDYRRKGLALALILILFVVTALWLYIRAIENTGKAG